MTTWMIVEDEPDIYEVLLAMFAMWGVEGVAFVDGEEAVAWIDDVDAGRFEGELPEVALLDIRLPGPINGVMVGERLRKSPKLRHIAIILNTAYKLKADEEAEDVRRSGADKLLYKPFPRFDEVKRLIEETIVQRKAQPEQLNQLLPEHLVNSRNEQSHILVVDDEAAIRYSFSKTLRRAGHIVTSLSSGEEVLEFLRSNPDHLPDTILTDISMPGISGLDVLRTIKTEPRWRHIPVILATGYHTTAIRKEAEQLGTANYLIKPITSQQLQESVLATVTNKKIVASPSTETEEKKQKSQKTILLIDDESLIVDMLARFLTLMNHRSQKALNGREALDAIEKSIPDLILCDLKLPDIDGFDILAAVRANPKTRHIPFVIMSAFAPPPIEKARQKGANGYLAKPTQLSVLSGCLANCFALKQPDKSPLRQPIVVTDTPQIQSSIIESKYHIADSESSLISQVAIFTPDVILLGHPEEEPITSALRTLRAFDLSGNLPIVVKGSNHLLQEQNLFLLGADIVCRDDTEEITSALDIVIKQYQSPALVETGDPWQILIASPNEAAREQVAADLTETYYAEVCFAATLRDCLDHLDQQFNLLIVDTDLARQTPVDTLVRQLRDQTDTPIILIAPPDALTIQQQFELGVRAIWTKPIAKETITITIERLLRYRREPKPLVESWAQYHILRAEAEYEAEVRDQQPSLAAIMQEVGALYSGLIHDLRNSIYALNSQITVLKKRLKDAPADVAALQQAVDYVAILLEQIANGRFKGVWSPKQYDDTILGEIVERAVAFAEKAYPDTSFLFENNFNGSEPPLVIDESQIVNTLTSLLASLAKTVPYIVISLSSSKDYQITFAPADWTNETASQFLQQNYHDNVVEYDLGLLSADRFIRRHRGTLAVEGNSLVMTLPAGGWESDLSLRLDIARAADVYETLREQLDAQVQSDKQPVSVAPLITETAVELVRWFGKVVSHAYTLGEAGRRLQLASRFGLLLASNLLVTSAGYKPQPRAVEIAPLLDNLYQLREDRLKNCTVTMHVEPDTSPVFADELGLMQIMVNLVTNALEAMAGTGELSIVAAPHAEGVQITVTDTGNGIPPEQLNRIFDLFYTTKQGQERGVGLHIVTSIVQQFGGRVEAQSVVGQGTTFTIILPAARQEQG